MHDKNLLLILCKSKRIHTNQSKYGTIKYSQNGILSSSFEWIVNTGFAYFSNRENQVKYTSINTTTNCNGCLIVHCLNFLIKTPPQHMITLWFQFKTFSSLIQTEVYTHFLKIVYLNSEKFLKHSRNKFCKKTQTAVQSAQLPVSSLV